MAALSIVKAYLNRVPPVKRSHMAVREAILNSGSEASVALLKCSQETCTLAMVYPVRFWSALGSCYEPSVHRDARRLSARALASKASIDARRAAFVDMLHELDHAAAGEPPAPVVLMSPVSLHAAGCIPEQLRKHVVTSDAVTDVKSLDGHILFGLCSGCCRMANGQLE
eukprot:3046078-Prymnesium_polylepis.2